MSRQKLVRTVLGALLAVSTVGLTACQSSENTEPMAITGQTDEEQAQPVYRQAKASTHRNWGKFRR